MKTLAELQQERAAKVEAQQNLVTTVKEAKRDFSEDEETRFDGFTEEIEGLDNKIARAQKIETAEKRAADLDGELVDGEEKPKQKREGGEDAEKRSIKKRASVLTALRSVMKNKPLEGAEKEMNDLAMEENRAAGVETPDNAMLNIPMSMVRATGQTVSEDSGSYGGALVKDEAPRVQMPFSPSNVLEDLGATRLTGLSGGNIPLPVFKDYDFNWLGETEKITPQKKEISGPSLSPNRLGAAVEISNRLLLQSSVDVEGMIRGRLGAGYERAINAAAINGSGASNQPTGVLNTTGVQQSAIATTQSVPDRAMVVELPALIEAANASENSLGFLMSPALKALLQNTKVDAGSGLFLMPGPNGLNGYKAVSSTLVPQLSANEVLIFGDWSQLFIGEWGSLSVLTDPYSASLSNSVRLVLNGHADVQIAQPDAFAVNKFLNSSAT